MKHSIFRPFATVALLCMVGSALAVGLTGHLDPLHDEVEERVAELDGATDRSSKKLRKRLQKVLRKLDKKSLTKSLKNEIRGSRGAVKQLTKALEGDQEIQALVDDLAQDYRGEIDLSRAALEQQIAGLPDGNRKRKKLTRKLEKADSFLAAFEDEGDDAKRLKFLLKAVSKTGEVDATSGDRFVFVVHTLAVAQGAGVDVTGDGIGDNALGQVLESAPPAADLATQAMQQSLVAGDIVILLDAFGVDSTQEDVLFTLGIGSGTDSNGDPADNFDGNEEFLVPAALLDEQGRLAAQATGAIEGGVFLAGVEESGIEIPVGPRTLSPQGVTLVRGSLGSGTIEGVITFVISVADAEALLAAFAPPEAILPPGFVGQLADVDTDGNGTLDSLSASFQFGGVPASIREQ